MPYTAEELANITNSALDNFMGKGQMHRNAIQNKPLMQAFDRRAGTFSGGKGLVSYGVKAGQGGGSLQGYSGDDQVGFYNPATNKRVNFAWKEHHIGIGLTHSELKVDGITVTEQDASQSTSKKDGREEHALAELLDEKLEDMNEDYAVSWDALLHGDGSSDVKAIAGIQSFILDDPSIGSTGGLSRNSNVWWRNRAATAAYGANGGEGAITSAVANGGALIQFLQKEHRQLSRFARGSRSSVKFAGSDFIDAYERELRANGGYTEVGFKVDHATDGYMGDVKWNGKTIVYDPTLDDMGRQKYCYDIDFRRIRLLYMKGERMKKSTPARPYDRYVMYKGCTTTAVMIARQLNTSAVYQIN